MQLLSGLVVEWAHVSLAFLLGSGSVFEEKVEGC